MTAPSPDQLVTGAPSFTITVNGSALAATIQIVSIDVWAAANEIPRARLVVADGSAADECFPISDGTSLIPSVKLEIAMGYDSSTATVFSGVIYRQALEITDDGPSRLVVEASDKAMAMTLARANAVFRNMTDSAICAQLISNAGLTPKVTSTSTKHETIVQYYATGWDMLVMRAQANSMVVTVSAGTVTVAPPDTSGSPVLALTFGQSILDLRLEMDASTQYAASAIQSYAWDPGTQALAQSAGARSSVSTPGNISSATLAKVFNVGSYVQQTGGEMVQAELTDWSSAELTKRQLSKIRGQIRFQGSALVTPGKMVALARLGDRFNGNAYVSGVHQSLSEGLWFTTIDVGLSPSWFAETAPRIAAADASGQLPPMNNLQTGIVKQIDQDPDGEYRVLVTLPLLQATDGVWARFGAFYASNGVGAAFYPEIGDEVVLGFLNGDPRYPVILGSLYSKANAPPNPPTACGADAPNNTKSITTKSKLRIDFVESDPQLTIVTPANQSVTLNDKAKSVTLIDANGNSITLDASGITLNSASDITLTAGGSITMTASADVSIGASASLSAKGDASASLSSSGQMQLSGASVALNP